MRAHSQPPARGPSGTPSAAPRAPVHRPVSCGERSSHEVLAEEFAGCAGDFGGPDVAGVEFERLCAYAGSTQTIEIVGELGRRVPLVSRAPTQEGRLDTGETGGV